MERLTDEMLQEILESTEAATTGPIELRWPACDAHGVPCTCADFVEEVLLPEQGAETEERGGMYRYKQVSDFSPDFWKWAVDAREVMPHLIAEVERLRDHVKEYREALKPFAALAKETERRGYPDESPVYGVNDTIVLYGDFCRARTLLEKE